MRDFASDESKDALIAYQAVQLDRLSHVAYGLPYVAPDPDWLTAEDEEDETEPEPPPRSIVFVVESLMSAEDIFRKPPRVAAPRLIERLAAAGIYLTTFEEAS